MVQPAFLSVSSLREHTERQISASSQPGKPVAPDVERECPTSLARSPTVVLLLGLPRWYKSQSLQSFPSASELNLLYLFTPRLVFTMPSPTETKASFTLKYTVRKWSIVELKNSRGSVETGNPAPGPAAPGVTAVVFSLSGSQEYSIKLTEADEPHNTYTIKWVGASPSPPSPSISKTVASP